jgi:DNA modification methylase
MKSFYGVQGHASRFYKKSPWPLEAPCTLGYRAGYRIKQIFYSNDRSIGCSSMLPAGGSGTGQEKTPEEYIEKLVTIFRELRRVLKDTGSFYLNLGDTYIGPDSSRVKFWKRPKQLALIPSRVAIALQEDGWILRNDIC